MTNNERTSFYSIKEFDQLTELCQNWEIVKNELLQLNAPIMNISRDGRNYIEVFLEIANEIVNGNQYGWIKGWGMDSGNEDWIQYGIMFFPQFNNLLGFHISKNLPQTYRMISNIIGVKLCAFVNLKKHSILHCHKHPDIHNQGLLQLHLPLLTATERNYAYLNVNGEFKQHRSGKPIIFDGSLDHFAINESDEDRIILYLEFKINSRPFYI